MILIDLILDTVGYTTSRLLLPILTSDRVRVDLLPSSETGFNWLGFKRLPDGGLLCDSNTAGWMGALFWLVAFAIIVTVAMN
jgi:hypothetical protein